MAVVRRSPSQSVAVRHTPSHPVAVVRRRPRVRQPTLTLVSDKGDLSLEPRIVEVRLLPLLKNSVFFSSVFFHGPPLIFHLRGSREKKIGVV